MDTLCTQGCLPADEQDLSFHIATLDLFPVGTGIFEVDNGRVVRFLYLSESYYTMIGVSPDTRTAFMGNNVLNAVYADDVPGLEEAIRRAIGTGGILEYSLRLMFGDGAYRWIGIRARHKKQASGKYHFYVGYYDIETLNSVREKLHDEDMLLHSAVSVSETLYFIYYPQQHQYEAIVQNARFKKFPSKLKYFPQSFFDQVNIFPSDSAAYADMIRSIDLGSPRSACDFRIIEQDKTRWYRVQLTSIYDEKGNIEKALGYMVDITDLKSAEKHLSDELIQMQALNSSSSILATCCFNVTKDYPVEMNVDGCLRSVDVDLNKMARLAGSIDSRIPKQQQLTRKVLYQAAGQIPDPERREEFIRNTSHVGLMKMFEDNQTERRLEYRRCTERGLIWVSTRIKLVRNPNSGDIFAFIYTSDINERKLAEEVNLRIVQDEYETCIVLDLGSMKLFRPKGVAGRSHSRMLGMQYDEMIQKHIPRVVLPSDVKATMHNFSLPVITQHLEKARKYTFTYQLKSRVSSIYGNPHKMEQMDVFYLNKDKDMLVFVPRDITQLFIKEQQKNQEMAALVKQAEKASVAKSDFLSRMSHDIRTPLNGIIGMTFLAKDEYDIDAVKGYLEKIDKSSKFLLGLINDILDMSKVESGKMELHPEPYSYEEFVQDIKSVIEPLCAEKQVHFELKFDGDPGPGVLVDRLRFNQVFFNLLSNAVKFTDAGGHVTFTLHTAGCENGMLNITCTVSDDGIGMSKEFQQRLFMPFEQEYVGRRSVNIGSGLGLAIAKRIVDLMGGTVEVDSELGKGSTFVVRLSLPVAQTDSAPVIAAAQKEVSLEGRRILLVEDNAINAEIAKALLMKKHADVTLAYDGKQAVEAFSKSEQGWFDAILMDIRMPVLDGIGATIRIRSLDRPDAASVPIIAMTANAFADDVRESLAIGMTDHVSKPVDPQKLYEALHRALSGR